jgi:aspartokinase/homoserine dehydrogenase 1
MRIEDILFSVKIWVNYQTGSKIDCFLMENRCRANCLQLFCNLKIFRSFQDSRELILTDSHFGNANVDYKKPMKISKTGNRKIKFMW